MPVAEIFIAGVLNCNHILQTLLLMKNNKIKLLNESMLYSQPLISSKSELFSVVYLGIVVLCLTLATSSATAQSAYIKIISEPGAAVFLDSERAGIIPEEGILTIDEIRNGNYKIKVVKGSKTMNLAIDVPDKNERILYFELQNNISEDRSPVHRSSKNELLHYENQRVFYGKFTDHRDGKKYRTVKIGDEIWMAENLRFEIPLKSFVYPRDPLHEQVYGRLYTWDAAVHACPDGWHLPADREWFQLEKQLGITDTILVSRGWRKCSDRASLKSDSGWLEATSSIDTLGFSAFPGGYRDQDNYFFNEGYFAYFWTSTDVDASDAWYRVSSSDLPDIGRFSYSKKYAFSIRCVKNAKK